MVSFTCCPYPGWHIASPCYILSTGVTSTLLHPVQYSAIYNSRKSSFVSTGFKTHQSKMIKIVTRESLLQFYFCISAERYLFQFDFKDWKEQTLKWLIVTCWIILGDLCFIQATEQWVTYQLPVHLCGLADPRNSCFVLFCFYIYRGFCTTAQHCCCFHGDLQQFQYFQPLSWLLKSETLMETHQSPQGNSNLGHVLCVCVELFCPKTKNTL